MEARRTKADWDKIIEKFNMSDQTQSEFSRENGINVKSLGNQLRKRIAKKNSIVKRSNEEWIALITEQRSSGVNRSTWCKERGISPDSMLSAERRLVIQLQKTSEPKWIELNPVKKTDLKLDKNDDVCWGIKICGNGIEIEVNSNYPVEKLTTLIERLVKQ